MPNHMPCHNYPLSFAKIGSGWEVSNVQFQKIFIPSHHRRDWNFLGGGGWGFRKTKQLINFDISKFSLKQK